MQTQVFRHLALESDKFKDLMIEAKELLDKTMTCKYNLANLENLENYDLWSKYILSDVGPEINSPGYKISFLQVMSIILVLRAEKEEPIPDTQPVQKEEKIINFLSYKASKENDKLYNM